MKIAPFGSAGALAGYFQKNALSAGYEVTALVRSPEKLCGQPNLNLVKGDVKDISEVQSVIDHADLLVNCLGDVKGVLIMGNVAEAILQVAAAQLKPLKCPFVSSMGCVGASWIVKQMLQLIGGRSSFADYEFADKRISQEAKVLYVLIRPAALKDKT